MGTQHSGLREDNDKINSLFNYLLSHALTAGRAIVRYRVWGGSRVSAAPNNRARLTPMAVTLGQHYNVGEKPAAILYTYINRHAGTPKQPFNKQKHCKTYQNQNHLKTVWYVIR